MITTESKRPQQQWVSGMRVNRADAFYFHSTPEPVPGNPLVPPPVPSPDEDDPVDNPPVSDPAPATPPLKCQTMAAR